jgi:stage III sporulation protein SpoIIIAA
MLSADLSLVVVVVDKSNELGGDGMTPHDAIGSARWMPVGKRGMQADVLREAVENQTPDVVICDEISTTAEVEAARTMGQRGVRIIASVHGSTLAEVAHCSQRGILLGGQVPCLLWPRRNTRSAPACLAQRHTLHA